jgi:hypothetical protein
VRRHTDKFPPTQLYAVLILTNAGVDLEHCTLPGLVQAKSILFQACLSIAAIEKVREYQLRRARHRLTTTAQKYRFEHRDLHWGNILTAPTTQTTVRLGVPGFLPARHAALTCVGAPRPSFATRLMAGL